jgi:iron complex outermembrane receptor protein
MFVSSPSRFYSLARGLSVLLFIGVCSAIHGQSSASGSIEGRVLNATAGNYLTNARVTVEGTAIEAFTDSFGQYRIANLPAGDVKLRVFYTGLPAQTASISVAPGQNVQRDFALGTGARADGQDGILKLDEYVVAASREMTGAAIAINQQRFAPNVSTVVSAEEFGDNVDGNPGEFLKFLPGITADTVGSGEPRVISVRGLPSSATPITIDGFRLASASSSNQSRTVEFDQVTLNNMARIEISKSQTPDAPADAVGGSVNMISKTAFESTRRVFNYRVYATGRRGELSFDRTAGPGSGPSIKIQPGFDFSYIVPVNSRFGFTITGEDNKRWGPQYAYNKAWVPNGQTGGLATATADNPYLERYEFLIGKGYQARRSIGLTLDYKLTDRDVVSLTFNEAYFALTFDNRDYTWDTGSAVTSWGPTFTQGGATRGSVSNQGPNSSSWREKTGTTWQPSLIYRHRGPIWKIDGGAGFSHATNHYRDIDKGFFQTMNLVLSGVTLRYDGIKTENPGTITATDATGKTVDTLNLANYRIMSASTNPRETSDAYRSARINLGREFGREIPMAVKVGADVRQNSRDIRSDVDGNGPITWTYLGPDHVANTADDTAAGIVDDDYTAKQASPFGMPRAQWPSPYKLWQVFNAHPDYFTSNAATNYQNVVNGSSHLSETVSAAYLRGDLHAFNNRLWVVGGFRYERTTDKGEGPLVSRDAIYQHDAAGKLVLNAAGKPIVTTTDAVAQARLIFQNRGAHATRTYDGIYPSLNASFNVTPDLLARFAMGRTINRPDYSNIIPGATVPDPTATPSDTLTIKNTSLKPWTADNFDLSLEYYFNQSAGVLSASAFRRNVKDFISSVTRPVTPDDFTLYGIDSALYPNLTRVSTSQNVGNARVDGVEFNYKQSLTFLPHWARGVQIMTNGTLQHVSGANAVADFSGFITQTTNAGISLSRERYSVKLNWNHRGRQKQGLFAGPNYFNYQVPKDVVDLNAEFRPRRNLTVFLSIRNILNQSENGDRYNDLTPTYARGYNSGGFVPLYNFGVRGTF